MVRFFGPKEPEAVREARALLEQGDAEGAARLLARDPHPLAQFHYASAMFKLNRLADLKSSLLKLLSHANLDESVLTLAAGLVGNRRLVSEDYFNSAPAFSSDGRRIVYASARRDTNGDGKINQHDLCGIYLMDLATSAEHCLVTDEAYTFLPSFSPDGRKIVYLSCRRDTNRNGRIDHLDNAGIYVLDLERGEETLLVPDDYQNKYPSFSPDGRHVLYTSWRNPTDRSGVWMVDLTSGRETQLVSDRFDNAFPSWSPDGRRALFSSWRNDTNGDGRIDLQDNSELRIVEVRTQEERTLVEDRWNNMYAAWSPDGERVAYLSRRRDTNGDGRIDSLDNCGLYVVEVATNRERCIVPDTRYCKFPSFTPNGKSLAYLGSPEEGQKAGYFDTKGVYLVELSSKRERRVVSDKHFGCRHPVISPTGNYLAYLSWAQTSNRGIFLADISGVPTRDKLKAILLHNLPA